MRKIDLDFLESENGVTQQNQLPVNGSSTRNHNRATLSPALISVLKEVQTELGNQSAAMPDYTPGEAELQALVSQVSTRLGLEITSYERDQVLEYVENDTHPFGILTDLVQDPGVSDIIVTSYSKIGVQQGRLNYNTDIRFPSQGAFESFVERLLKRAGTTYSTKKPIADGMVGSDVRIHAVHKSICSEGPYVTIRINRFRTVRLEELTQFGLAPTPLMNYLVGVIALGQTVLIAGEVGTGKTTLVRALAGTIPEDESILVIEDTPEIKLSHPHVRSMQTREENIEGMGKVSPSECIRGGMRMAMNRIIFGEMRDAEAAESFVDVCASGHPGLSTIHAKSALDAIARLELFLGRAQKGVDPHVLSQQVATAVQVIVHVNLCKITGKRRIMNVKEIGPVADGVLRHRDIFRYEAEVDGSFGWKVVNRVSAVRDELEELDPPVKLSSLPARLVID